MGSGGREDALAWRLRQSPSCAELVAAPGNPGIARWAECVAVDPIDEGEVIELARVRSIDLIVIGPEAPLVAGVGDALRDAGFAVFGPNAAAAQLEGSKGFTKDLCRANGIPTADYERVETVAEARAALALFGAPVVIKADGLAAGKGVTVAMTIAEAETAIDEAGDGPLVIEEFLEGEEASLFALVDGETAVPLASAQDHKRVGEGDTGPNTGGMGAYCPYPLDQAALDGLRDGVFRPVLAELAVRGASYVGVLYAGLVLAADGPKVLEFNARFGDPETQALLPRLSSDLAEVLAACAAGRLASTPAPRWDERSAVTVVLASGGYPAEYQTGKPISGLDEAAAMDGALVFHAGTRLDGDQVVTAGGRVLAVTGLADTVGQAREIAYAAADRIDFDGMQRRDDIAAAG